MNIFLYTNYRPEKVVAVGHLTDETGEGVDAAVSATFIYKKGGTARFQTSCRVETACEGKIYGTKGIV